MQVLITGVGDAFTAEHFGSSALIKGPFGFVQLDCPDPFHRVLKEATLSADWTVTFSDIHDLIITHLHGDHCNGVESFGFAHWFRRQKNEESPRPRLHATQPVIDRLWERLAPAMDGTRDGHPTRTLDTFFDARVLRPHESSNIAGLRVDCRFTGHPIPTIGVKIYDGPATFGWSGDTPFEQAHVDWLSDSDLIVHECNLGTAHTPIEKLNALPDELRARMRLIHLPDDFDVTATDMRPVTEGEVLAL